LFIERLSISDAAPHELRPFWNGWYWISLLRQQRPKIRVMPAKIVSRTVTVLANPGAKFPHFGNKFSARHLK